MAVVLVMEEAGHFLMRLQGVVKQEIVTAQTRIEACICCRGEGENGCKNEPEISSLSYGMATLSSLTLAD